MGESPKELDELYALPLEDFTAARNALVKRLRDAGDGDLAKTVSGLKKPNVPAWAVNQLAQQRRDDLRELLSLRQKLAEVGDAGEIRALSAQRKRLVAELVESAESILEDAGHSATSAHVERIVQTLQAGATEEERSAILRGTLTRELAPAGFEDMSGWAVAQTASESSAQKRAQKKDELRRLEAEADSAEKHAASLERDAEDARAAADRAEEKARRARMQATKARAVADKAAARD